ncbi:MAG: alpha/beta hydrolase [Limnobacter sp.]|nr:alpha/beta hydrolase [Limnobacter sp.]
MGGCSAVQLVNSVSRIYDVHEITDVPFGQNAQLKLDLYLPDKPPLSQERTPVVVFFYGGSWNRGDKAEYAFAGRKLASMGFIVGIPNYRLYPEVTYPAFLEDSAQGVKKVLELTRQEAFKAYRPADQVVVMGHSAGAYNAAMLAMDDRWLASAGLNRKTLVQGLIGMAGAYNIYPIRVPEVKPVFHHPNYPEKSQPIDFVKESNIDTLILAPENDDLVSLERNSFALAKALAQNSTPKQLVTVKGTDHISLIGTLSPLLFFKGDSAQPIAQFIHSLQKPQTNSRF